MTFSDKLTTRFVASILVMISAATLQNIFATGLSLLSCVELAFVAIVLPWIRHCKLFSYFACLLLVIGMTLYTAWSVYCGESCGCIEGFDSTVMLLLVDILLLIAGLLCLASGEKNRQKELERHHA